MADEGQSFGGAPDFFSNLINAGFNWSAGKKAREAQAEANTKNAELQRDFAQHGIQWKVQDARAAGLHPLYAIGAAGASASPSFAAASGAEFTSRMGQNLSRAASAAMTQEDKALNNARLKVLESEADKNFALASAARSEEQRAWLQQWQSRPLNLDGGGIKADPFWALSADSRIHRPQSNGSRMGDGMPPPGQIKGKPDEVISAKVGAPQATAGTHPAWREYQVTPGFTMQLPYSEEGPGEALENVPFYLWPSVIGYNAKHYGKDWGERFVRFILGRDAPKEQPLRWEDDYLNRWRKGAR